MRGRSETRMKRGEKMEWEEESAWKERAGGGKEVCVYVCVVCVCVFASERERKRVICFQ